MAVPRMHDDEVPIDDGLVRGLLVEQMPQYADHPLTRIEAWGTDHVIYRLGRDLSVRLPKVGWAVGQVATEDRWLAVLAPRLPVDVPVPLVVGRPTVCYPFPWCVSPWLEGENPGADPAVDRHRLALDIAAFVNALQTVATAGAPRPARGRRGGPLEDADEATRRAAAQLHGETDVDLLLSVWDDGRHAAPWAGPPVWVHGDLMDGNLLLRAGRLGAVIDWGGSAAGDPAVDLMVAWSFLDRASRSAFREALANTDDDMWRRGRAWSVSAALQALPYYRHTNPDIVARSWHAIGQVLDEAKGNG